MSKIAMWDLKYADGSQFVAGQSAIGAPQLSGSGAFAVMSTGIELRGKKNTAIPESSHFTNPELNKPFHKFLMRNIGVYSLAYTPPPLALNAAPKEFV